MNKNNLRIATAIIVSGLGVFISYLINFLLTPYITDNIGMRPIYYVYTLTLKNKLPCWITIAGGFLNVVSMYVLLKYTQMGVYVFCPQEFLTDSVTE